jgi:diaminohydroxyphosphoribosylaminopyrimidine deaminase/5-amino-6-(5-phosphoribosylamino)uracil reductase
VRADDPALTVRDLPPPWDGRPRKADPLRVVLGRAAPGARIHPCLERSGRLPDLLDELGGSGCVQLLVEGGARVAAEFHRSGLVDRYVLYLAPALFGGDDAPGLFAGPGAATIGDLWRGRLVDLRRLGRGDVRLDLVPIGESTVT